MMILQREVLHGKQGVDKEVRRLDDDVDVLYTAIKLYLAQIQKEDLGEEDSRRWAEIIEMALNLEQAGDIIERMAGDVGAKSHAARRAFSTEGLAELDGLHERLIGRRGRQRPRRDLVPGDGRPVQQPRPVVPGAEDTVLQRLQQPAVTATQGPLSAGHAVRSDARRCVRLKSRGSPLYLPAFRAFGPAVWRFPP